MSNINKVCIWADGTCCNYDQLQEYLSFMSDDYEVVEVLPTEIVDKPLFTDSYRSDLSYYDYCGDDEY